MIKRMTKNARKPSGFWGRIMIKKMNAGHFEMTKWAIGKINIPSDGAVADIGCGGGNCVKLLSAMTNGMVYGIDYSPLCVEKAKRKNRKAVKSDRVKIIEASVEKLPFKTESIDCAVSVESVYFWRDPYKAFGEILRVLKKGGELNVICEMVKNDDGTGAHTEVAELLKLNYYSAAELENIFRQSRFNDISIKFDKEHTWLLISGKK